MNLLLSVLMACVARGFITYNCAGPSGQGDGLPLQFEIRIPYCQAGKLVSTSRELSFKETVRFVTTYLFICTAQTPFRMFAIHHPRVGHLRK